jgi:uncharacterized protein YlzI (FlbEa/FlbD family)
VITELLLTVAITFVELHGPTGRIIVLNSAEISSLREPLDTNAHWARGVRCIIVMTNGKYIAVLEKCTAVEQKLNDGK